MDDRRITCPCKKSKPNLSCPSHSALTLLTELLHFFDRNYIQSRRLTGNIFFKVKKKTQPNILHSNQYLFYDVCILQNGHFIIYCFS